jgi:hypothetical protein
MCETEIAQGEDNSVSSSLSDTELNTMAEKAGIPANVLTEAKQKTEEQTSGPALFPFVGIGEAKKEVVFEPYTFDPASLREPALPSMTLPGPSPSLAPEPSDEAFRELTRPPYNNFASSNPGALSKPTSEYLVPDLGSKQRYRPVAEAYPRAAPTAGYSALNEDPAATRGTQEYQDFAKDFDREFGKDKASQKEIDGMAKRLDSRYRSLQEFSRELERADVDMLLFRNKLIREISDVQSDFREASSNLMVLMKDRASMKDAFCLLQVRVKKLKSLEKTLQEDIAT